MASVFECGGGDDPCLQIMASVFECGGGDDDYVSFSVSQDSDDEDFVTHIIARTKSLFEDPEALFPETDCFSFDLFHAIQASNTKNLSETLMGGYTGDQVYTPDNALVPIPDPRVFHDRVKNIRKHTELKMCGLTLHPFLSFRVKSELLPMGPAVQFISTLILIIAWIQVVLLGSGGWIISVVGGVALFVGSSMLHFWYGFTRYHGFSSGFKSFLQARALDEPFEYTRDICSRQCHGDWHRRRSAFIAIWTLPSTLPYHLLTTMIHGLHGMIRWMLRRGPAKSDRAARKWATHICNGLLALSWVQSTPIVMTYSLGSFLVNQRFYDALLFRRNWSEFLSSLLFGGVLVLSPRVRLPARSKSQAGHETRDAATMELSEIMRSSLAGNGKNDNESTKDNELRTASSLQSQVSQVKTSETTSLNFSDTSGKKQTSGLFVYEDNDSSNLDRQGIDAESTIESKSHDPNVFAARADQGLQGICRIFGATSNLNESRHSINDDGIVNMKTTLQSHCDSDTEHPDEGSLIDHLISDISGYRKKRLLLEMESQKNLDIQSSVSLSPDCPHDEPPMFTKLPASRLGDDEHAREDKNAQIDAKPPSHQQNLNADAMANCLNSDIDSCHPTMDTANIYIRLSTDRSMCFNSQPGTSAWKEAVREASRKYQNSAFGEDHFRFIIDSIGGSDRDFYEGCPSSGWTKLNTIPIRRRCEEAYNEEIEMIGEARTRIAENLMGEPPAAIREIGVVAEPFESSATVHNRPSIEVQLSRGMAAGQQGKIKQPLAYFARLVHPNSTNDKITAFPVPPKEARNNTKKRFVVSLGKKDDKGYKRFLDAIHSVTAASASNGEVEYTASIHSSVLLETNARYYLVEKVAGHFQEATEGEVLDFAWQYHAGLKAHMPPTEGPTREDADPATDCGILAISETQKKPERSTGIKKIFALRAPRACDCPNTDYLQSDQSVEVTDVIPRRQLPRRSTKKEWRQMYPYGETSTKEGATGVEQRPGIDATTQDSGGFDDGDFRTDAVIASEIGTAPSSGKESTEMVYEETRDGTLENEVEENEIVNLSKDSNAELRRGMNRNRIIRLSGVFAKGFAGRDHGINGVSHKHEQIVHFSKEPNQDYENRLDQTDEEPAEEGTEITDVMRRRDLPGRSTKKEWKQMYLDRKTSATTNQAGVKRWLRSPSEKAEKTIIEKFPLQFEEAAEGTEVSLASVEQEKAHIRSGLSSAEHLRIQGARGLVFLPSRPPASPKKKTMNTVADIAHDDTGNDVVARLGSARGMTHEDERLGESQENTQIRKDERLDNVSTDPSSAPSIESSVRAPPSPKALAKGMGKSVRRLIARGKGTSVRQVSASSVGGDELREDARDQEETTSGSFPSRSDLDVKMREGPVEKGTLRSEEAMNRTSPSSTADSPREEVASSSDFSINHCSDAKAHHRIGVSSFKSVAGIKLKQMLSHVRAVQPTKRADIERMTDLNSRRDQTKVNRWLEINRNKSMFLKDIWAKATLSLSLKQQHKFKGDDVVGPDTQFHLEMLDDSMSLEEEDYDVDLGTFSQDSMRGGCMREESFFEELRVTLVEEYRRATGHPDAVAELADEISDGSMGTSFTGSFSNTDETTEILPQTLLEFVEWKIDNEILHSSECGFPTKYQ